MQLAAIHLSVSQDVLTIQFQRPKQYLSVWSAQADGAAPGENSFCFCLICGVNTMNAICHLHFCHNVIVAHLIREAEPYAYVYTDESKHFHVD